MTTAWPKWATVRAEEVRTVLSPKERGPWTEEGACSRGIPPVFGLPDTQHDAEPPYFYHCRSCLKGVQKGGVLAPHPARDKGLCIQCGEPAELDRRVVRGDRSAAQQAESQGLTVARLSTRQWCRNCDPHRRPWCNSRLCKNSKKHRALPAGYCRHSRLHCSLACDKLRENEAARKKSLHAARREAGNCVHCGKHPSDGEYVSCKPCRGKRRRRNRMAL